MFSNRDHYYETFKILKCGVFTIEGIIGVGKSTLGRSLESFLNQHGIKTKFYPEYVNELLLSQYLNDMKKYAYSFQLFMLCKRIEIYREAERFALTGGVALIDRSIIGDYTFAKMHKDNGNFTEEEWQTYLSVMKQEIQLTPSKSIYLKCNSETSLKRVKIRGIKSEIEGYNFDYMDQLNNAYEKSINECTNVSHIVLEWNKDIEVVNGILKEEDIIKILLKLI